MPGYNATYHHPHQLWKTRCLAELYVHKRFHKNLLFTHKWTEPPKIGQ